MTRRDWDTSTSLHLVYSLRHSLKRVVSRPQSDIWRWFGIGIHIGHDERWIREVVVDRTGRGTSVGARVSAPFAIEEENQFILKLDLRVATIVHAETIPKSKKLLKIEIDMGERRTIVSGISESYRPEDIVGMQVVVLANLKPAKLMGITSKGMLLTAGADSGDSLVILDRNTVPGSSVN